MGAVGYRRTGAFGSRQVAAVQCDSERSVEHEHEKAAVECNRFLGNAGDADCMGWAA